jgi:hypothetical protein
MVSSVPSARRIISWCGVRFTIFLIVMAVSMAISLPFRRALHLPRLATGQRLYGPALKSVKA